jgi:hypothetical protein
MATTELDIRSPAACGAAPLCRRLLGGAAAREPMLDEWTEGRLWMLQAEGKAS